MNHRHTDCTFPTLAAGLVAMLLVALPASAASPVGQPDAKSPPQRARIGCTTVRGDVRDNCLSEASTLAASTRPSRADESAEQLARNALRRCEPLSEPDRGDCVARMRGQGTTTGSVAAGGIYRELVTREVGAVPVPGATVAPAAADAPK
jgi:hypothetical protein